MKKLSEAVEMFAKQRDWDQFHSPKNLSMALAIEAGELMEHFLWLTQAESRELPQERVSAIGAEVGDVMIYLTRLCQVLGLDPLDEATRKLELNEKRYPVERARGVARKYTELQDDE